MEEWKLRLWQMNDYRKSKLKKWEVVLVDRFPKMQNLESLTYLGSFAWTQPHIKRKFVNARFAHDLGGGIVTPSDIARDYLACKFDGKRLRCNKNQYQQFVKNRIHQPLYAEPVHGMKASYLDLKSAYWQCLMLGGWDVDYSRNKFLSVRSDVFDFPVPHMKLARNTLVSIGLPSQGTIYHPDKGLVRLKGGSSTVNLVLYGFVMDTLHAIASEMIDRAGAVYVNTDGYIVPSYLVEEAYKIADEWGVLLTERHSGYATVRGAGDYDIAQYRSSRPRFKPREFSYIHPPDKTWFKKRWDFFKHRIDMDYQPSLSELGLTN